MFWQTKKSCSSMPAGFRDAPQRARCRVGPGPCKWSKPQRGNMVSSERGPLTSLKGWPGQAFDPTISPPSRGSTCRAAAWAPCETQRRRCGAWKASQQKRLGLETKGGQQLSSNRMKDPASQPFELCLLPACYGRGEPHASDRLVFGSAWVLALSHVRPRMARLQANASSRVVFGC